MKNRYRYSLIFLVWSFFQVPTSIAIDLVNNNNISDQTKLDQSIAIKTIAQQHIEDIVLQTLEMVQENSSEIQLQEATLQLIQTISEYLNLTTQEVVTLDDIVNSALKSYETDDIEKEIVKKII